MATTDVKKSFKSSGRQKVRLFLEGREVPVTSVSLTSTEGQPMMATADMVPLQVLKFIKPRTQVHIFVRDSFTFGDDRDYLAFEGEVLGRTLAKRHDGRFVQLIMYDYSNYFDDAKAYMMNPSFLVGKMGDTLYGEPPPSSQAKANAGKVIETASTAQSQMIDYLTKFKDSAGAVDLVKGVANVCAVLSVVNEFYRASYERLRIIERIMIKSSGLTGNFLKQLKVEEFMNSYTGAHGGMQSLRQLLTGVMSLIFHEFISVPFPSFVETKRGSETGFTIAQFLFVPDSYLLPPPKCNVIFPNQQIGFEFSDDFRAAPTRYGFRFSFPMVADKEVGSATYPIQYYPRPFADYMAGTIGAGKTSQSSTADLNSLFGPSKLLVNGNATYGSIFYGGPREKAVGTAYSPKLRESDFLSNEESIRGIYYETDVLSPVYTALVRSGRISLVDGKAVTETGTDHIGRTEFMREVGAYLFLKKRYSARQVNASIMFNPFLVPGFSAMFIDDSEAGQSFIAKLQSTTHLLSNQGFSSTCNLAYARDFDEIDIMSGGTGDPPLPKWFDPTLYGFSDTDKKYFNLESNYLGPATTKVPGRSGGQGFIDEAEFTYRKDKVKAPTVYPTLSDFYQPLLGCNSVTEMGAAPKDAKKKTQVAIVTTRGAVQALARQYHDLKEQGARDEFVRKYVRRPVVTMEEAFAFVGAAPVVAKKDEGGKTTSSELAKFVAITDKKLTGLPGRFDGAGGGTTYSDKAVLEIRRYVVDTYIQQLQSRRGFRG